MSQKKQVLSRRELLKAMTALGGAVAASSLLPGKWTKPEVGAGVLPAHAQGTQDLFIYELSVQHPLNQNGQAPEIDLWNAKFNYNDPLGEVDGDAQLYADVSSGCYDLVSNWKTLTLLPATRIGDGFLGTISFNFTLSDCEGFSPKTLHVKLKVGERESNQEDQLFPETG